MIHIWKTRKFCSCMKILVVGREKRCVKLHACIRASAPNVPMDLLPYNVGGPTFCHLAFLDLFGFKTVFNLFHFDCNTACFQYGEAKWQLNSVYNNEIKFYLQAKVKSTTLGLRWKAACKRKISWQI